METGQGRWPNSWAVYATQWKPISANANWATHPPRKIRFHDSSRSQNHQRGTRPKATAHGGKGT